LFLLCFRKDYERINFPDNYETKFLDGFIHSRDIKAEELPQVIKNWPSFQILQKENEESANSVLQRFDAQLKSIVNSENLFKINLVLQTPFFVIMGRKK
jgi:hypothetical protein